MTFALPRRFCRGKMIGHFFYSLVSVHKGKGVAWWAERKPRQGSARTVRLRPDAAAVFAERPAISFRPNAAVSGFVMTKTSTSCSPTHATVAPETTVDTPFAVLTTPRVYRR